MHQVVVPELTQLRARRSVKWRAFESDVLPLPVAEMDFELAEPILRELHAAVNRSDTGYAWPGTELGEAVSAFAYDQWKWEIDPLSVTAIADVGAGIVELLRALCPTGAGVVVNPPVYAPFFEWIPEAGCRVVEAPLTDTYRLDFDALEAAFAGGAAAYLMCNPHNPVGRVHSAEDLATVVRLAERYDVVVLSDEVHSPLVLPGATHTPLLTVPGAAERAVALVSASKCWNLAGLKCAQIVTGSAAMREVTERFPSSVGYRVGHFGVIASLAAYREGGPWLRELLSTLDDRRQLLGRLIAEHLPEVRWLPPDATFLAWLDCRSYGEGDRPYERFLAAGVATDPGPKFGDQGSGFVRLNLATSAHILTEAMQRMATA